MPPVLTPETIELARDAGADELAPAEGATLTARLDPQTDVQVGRPVTLAIDASRLYYFDLDTETAL